MFEKTFNCEKFKLRDDRGGAIDSFKLRELNGKDETDAIARISGPDGKAAPGVNGFAHLNDQMVASSFVEVNGQPVPQPYVDWIAWPTRTRSFITAAYNSINEAAPAEIADFLGMTPKPVG